MYFKKPTIFGNAKKFISFVSEEGKSLLLCGECFGEKWM
jgi:hypothetical protein